MRYVDNKAEDLKIAYIGGGSKGWAWGLMSDLATAGDMSGSVYLYDIDLEAAKANEIIGNKFNNLEEAVSKWNYYAVETIEEALTGADFVVISILPGTLDEMESDVHTPEKYGIYQSVGDSTGPGGIVRAMRTIPMYEGFARDIEKYCPDAWVINYTNPMTLCIKTLYRVFPKIKAFGCCHEVFGTQKILAKMLKETMDIDAPRNEMKVNPIGVNHFTWVTSAQYKNIDLYPLYKDFAEKHKEGLEQPGDDNWLNRVFRSAEKVKFELFRKYGIIAAAGDRHLAEFCPGKWYLESPERAEEMKFSLTPVSYRKNELYADRLEKSARLLSGEEDVAIRNTGEEGVDQMRALLGLGDFVTNVNVPNIGQIPNLPMGAVVETNAVFSADKVTPVCAGEVPTPIYSLISRVVGVQELTSEGIAERNLEKIFLAFANDPLVTCGLNDARKLFDEMVENTKEYLTMFNIR